MTAEKATNDKNTESEQLPEWVRIVNELIEEIKKRGRKI